MNAALDSKRVAACGGAAYMDVIDVPAREKLFDGGIYGPIFHIFLRQKPTALGIGIQRSRATLQLSGKTCVFGITCAGFRMYVNRSGKRKLFEGFECVVGEERGLFARRNYF